MNNQDKQKIKAGGKLNRNVGVFVTVKRPEDLNLKKSLLEYTNLSPYLCRTTNTKKRK